MGQLTVGLFELTQEGGTRLVGRSSAPEVVDAVRDALLVERRAELARLSRDGDGPRLRAVADSDEPEAP